MLCTVCDKEKETRPYGKGGAAICFDCAMGSEETRRETECQFSIQLASCGQVAVLGDQVGPYALAGTSPQH